MPRFVSWPNQGPTHRSKPSTAAVITIVHGHPSGHPEPSAEDQAITRRLKEAGDLLGIKLLDHVVIGDGRYFSFADEGIL